MAMRFKNPLFYDSNIKRKDPYEDMPPLDCNSNINDPKRIEKESKRNEIGMEKCNCHRPLSAIFCIKCGHIFTGRMRIGCPTHPKIIHLMDSTNCPSCLSFSLKEYGTD